MENIQNSAVEELPTPMSKDERIPKKRAPTEDKFIFNVNEKAAWSLGEKNESSNKSSSSSSSSKNKQEKTTSSTSSTPTSSTTIQPPKKYTNNYNYNSNNNNNNNKQNNGAMDDFQYPYEKYTKEANFRFADNDDNEDGVNDDNADGEENDEIAAAAAGAGYFYDPETGRRLRPTDRDWHERVHERVRRASGSSGSSARREDNKNTCSLYIQTDPLIWRHIREGIADVSIHTHS